MMMEAFVEEADELSSMSHENMFAILSDMSDDELHKFRMAVSYPHKVFVQKMAERAAYLDVMVVTILRMRGVVK